MPMVMKNADWMRTVENVRKSDKAFVTSWDDVAYPPSKFKNIHLTQAEGQRMQCASALPFRVF